MKVGSLYACSYTDSFWSSCGPALYLGEDIINREDGVKIINHVFFALGRERVVDKSFLMFFSLYSM